MTDGVDAAIEPVQVSAMRLSLPEKLLIVMRRQGFTVAKASAKWGIEGRTLQSWIDGSRTPSPRHAEHIQRIVKRYESTGCTSDRR